MCAVLIPLASVELPWAIHNNNKKLNCAKTIRKYTTTMLATNSTTKKRIRIRIEAKHKYLLCSLLKEHGFFLCLLQKQKEKSRNYSLSLINNNNQSKYLFIISRANPLNGFFSFIWLKFSLLSENFKMATTNKTMYLWLAQKCSY